ncbi:unnamed protein product [Ostreobium quekettii]|uniref:FAS1 domain-containing protein n=1 Tax=Ostreobium quekettii TaxID=121088 RepID=A0A8S1J127_9CHLO|nr:unnamed protein product [Ostreobium quekettii]
MGRSILLPVLAALLLIGARAQDCTPLEDAASGAGLTTLLAALEATGLLGTVAEANNVTILAPSDAAFDAAVAALGITIDDLTNNDELLTEVLLYHVLTSQLFASELADGESYPTLLGNDSSCGVSTVGASVDGGEVTVVGGVTNASVVDTDFETCPGILHVVDFVLLPCPLGREPGDEPPIAVCPGLAEAAEEAGLTTFLAALAEAGLTDFLSGLNSSTVFCPTNAAFEAAVASLGITIDDLLSNQELLEEVLLYHVLETTVLSGDIVYGVDTETLLGANDSSCGVSTLAFEISDDGGVAVSGGASAATVLTPDVEICSGVLHVIDDVLLPCPSAPPPTAGPSPAPTPSATPPPPQCPSLTEAADEAGLTTLLAAIDAAGLTDALSTAPSYTIFAPTNEAFEAAVASLGITIDDLTNNI